MKVRDAMSVTPTRQTRPVAPARGYGPTGAAGAASGTNAARAPDAASFHGIPEAEMTPKVRAAIMSLLDEVRTLKQELDESQERVRELERLADRDPLVDLYNRRAFVRELGRAFASVERYNHAATLVYMDMNGLKAVNDTHGHAAGDAVLEHVGRQLSSNVRGADAVGRLGGDEFGVLLVNTSREMSEMKARQLADMIRTRPVLWKGKQLSVSVAYGVFPLLKGESVEAALEAADAAMYAQKRQGKDDASSPSSPKPSAQTAFKPL